MAGRWFVLRPPQASFGIALASRGSRGYYSCMARRREEDLTYESVRRACTAANEYRTEIELPIGPVICHFKNKRKSAHLDFALEKVLYRIELQKWQEIIKEQAAYVKANFARDDWSDMTGKFSDDGLKFDVLREDAEEWFEKIHGKLQRKEGLTGIAPHGPVAMEKPGGWKT
jgi:hypothetical protein